MKNKPEITENLKDYIYGIDDEMKFIEIYPILCKEVNKVELSHKDEIKDKDDEINEIIKEKNTLEYTVNESCLPVNTLNDIQCFEVVQRLYKQLTLEQLENLEKIVCNTYPRYQMIISEQV